MKREDSTASLADRMLDLAAGCFDAPTLDAPGRLHCFLEEFAGDAEFVRPSDPEQLPHSVAAPGSIVSNAIGRQVELEEFN
jgi:hypothetical protein